MRKGTMKSSGGRSRWKLGKTGVKSGQLFGKREISLGVSRFRKRPGKEPRDEVRNQVKGPRGGRE